MTQTAMPDRGSNFRNVLERLDFEIFAREAGSLRPVEVWVAAASGGQEFGGRAWLSLAWAGWWCGRTSPG